MCVKSKIYMYVNGECMCVRVEMYVCEMRMYVCENRNVCM